MQVPFFYNRIEIKYVYIYIYLYGKKQNNLIYNNTHRALEQSLIYAFLEEGKKLNTTTTTTIIYMYILY